MKTSVKNGIKKTVFLIFLLSIFLVVQAVLTPKFFDNGWNHRRIIQGYYFEKRDSLDVVLLGSSQFMSGFSPMCLYKNYDIKSYSLATSAQNLISSYYDYLEIRKNQNPSIIILEVQSLFQDTQSYSNHFGIDYFPFSLNKVKHVYSLFKHDAGVDSVVSFLIPMYTYHMRWESLSREDFVKEIFGCKYDTKGFSILVRSKKVNYDGIFFTDVGEEEECDNYKINYLKRLIEAIKEDHTELILVKTPRCDWTQEKHNTVQKIADQYNVNFLDYNEKRLYKETGFSGSTDYFDEGHLNYFGAIKLTNSVGNYLVEKYSFPRSSNYDESWDKSYTSYLKQVDKSMLSQIKNINEYLKQLSELGDLTIYISVKDDASKNLSDETSEKLQSLGLNYVLQDKYRNSYLAVIDKGNVYEEASQEECLNKNGISKSGCKYTVISGGYKNGNISEIYIDGKQYSTNLRGINIVVYDNAYGTVIDSVSFDTFSEEQEAKR